MLLHFLDAAKFESLEMFQQDYSDLSHGDQVTHMLTKPSQHTLVRQFNSLIGNLPYHQSEVVMPFVLQLAHSHVQTKSLLQYTSWIF